MFFRHLVTALAAAAAVQAMPAPQQLAEIRNAHLVTPETHIKDRYIVVFKDGTTANARSAHLNSVGTTVRQNNARLQARDGSSSKSFQGIRKNFNVFRFSAYSGEFDAATLEEIRKSPDVAYVAQDGIVKASKIQKDAPWGLARTSSPTGSGNATRGANAYETGDYAYNDQWAGKGVSVYVIDTGVNIEHKDFGGRAKWGYNAVNGTEDTDENGHGTHCAGTIGGTVYGIAKEASIFAVKVLDAQGSGTDEGVIDGINWVANNAQLPAVASMSLGGSASDPLDAAIKELNNANVVVSVAAGNENTDAGDSSPARVKDIITVGALDVGDKRAEFSNYGEVVDIFAPGVNITSAWIGSPDATDTISGTSMACPHISGLAAYFLSSGQVDCGSGNTTLFKRQDNGTDPSQLCSGKMMAKLKEYALPDMVQDPGSGSQNLIAFNGGEEGKPNEGGSTLLF